MISWTSVANSRMDRRTFTAARGLMRASGRRSRLEEGDDEGPAAEELHDQEEEEPDEHQRGSSRTTMMSTVPVCAK